MWGLSDPGVIIKSSRPRPVSHRTRKATAGRHLGECVHGPQASDKRRRNLSFIQYSVRDISLIFAFLSHCVLCCLYVHLGFGNNIRQQANESPPASCLFLFQAFSRNGYRLTCNHFVLQTSLGSSLRRRRYISSSLACQMCSSNSTAFYLNEKDT